MKNDVKTNKLVRKCENCRFFELIGNTMGYCKINPPVVFWAYMGPVDSGSVTQFPEMNKDSWCGQFVPNYTASQQLVDAIRKADAAGVNVALNHYDEPAEK